MSDTSLPVAEDEPIPGIYFKDRLLLRPNVIISSAASRGGVTTARDMMRFIKAFFNGILFSPKTFKYLTTYRRLQTSMGPIRYGGGHMRIPLCSVCTLFLGKGELLGHSGTTGSFAFYYPQKDLYFTGDVNQMADPSLPIRLLINLAVRST